MLSIESARVEHKINVSLGTVLPFQCQKVSKIKANNNSDPDYTFAVLGRLNKLVHEKKGKVINLFIFFFIYFATTTSVARAFVEVSSLNVNVLSKFRIIFKLIVITSRKIEQSRARFLKQGEKS